MTSDLITVTAMARRSLRTLIVVMLLGGPLCALAAQSVAATDGEKIEAWVGQINGIVSSNGTARVTQGKDGISLTLFKNPDAAFDALSKMPDEALSIITELQTLAQFARGKPHPTLTKLSRLKDLSVEKGAWSRGLAVFASQSKSLQSIFAKDAGISGTDLEFIGRSGELRELSIVNNDLRGEDLIALRSLRKLEQINISGPTISSRHVEFLGDCPQLAVVILAGTQVDDSVVDSLSKCKRLGIIVLVKTKFTREGARRLLKLAPGATISYTEEDGQSVVESGE